MARCAPVWRERWTRLDQLMLAHEFIRNALLAGSLIAVASGLIGYFVVLRSQVFAGDALSHVAFTGALAAAAAGLDLRVGLFAATVMVALLLAGLGERANAVTDDVTIGIVFVWILGLGVLFLDLFNASASSSNGTLAARALFGSIFALSPSAARLAAVIAGAILLALLAIARPLLFASLDLSVARVQGVPVRLLGFVFLVLLGLDAAEATQAVGALLLLGLLAAPAGAAHQLTVDPYKGMALSAAIALLSVWVGIFLSYSIPALPPSTAIVGVAAACYLLAAGAPALRSQRSKRCSA
ncbi:MAG TPA: metal ABC transporter permease [Solirubrobacteraceae bacterium]|nr:metal ABC transporter permease [Solirubrobacteraceae bacterium]